MLRAQDGLMNIREMKPRFPVIGRMPKVAIAVLIVVLTLGFSFLTYGQRSVVPFHTIAWGIGGANGPDNLLINDQTTWSAIWSQAFCGLVYCPPTPAVNFTLRSVVVSFLGWKPTAGFALNITQVTRVGPNTLIHLKVTEPGPSCYVAEIPTAPYHIVDIARTEGPAVFTSEVSRRNC